MEPCFAPPFSRPSARRCTERGGASPNPALLQPLRRFPRPSCAGGGAGRTGAIGSRRRGIGHPLPRQTVFSLRLERAWWWRGRAGAGKGGGVGVLRQCRARARPGRAPRQPASPRGGPREVARMTEGAEAAAAR